MCADPDNEVLLRCPGTTTKDVSMCIPNVASNNNDSPMRRVEEDTDGISSSQSASSSSDDDNSTTVVDIDTTQQLDL
jgi:hypothetical protein